jgi:hypothetical protein
MALPLGFLPEASGLHLPAALCAAALAVFFTLTGARSRRPDRDETTKGTSV